MSESVLRTVLKLSRSRPFFVRYNRERENWQALRGQLDRWRRATIFAESREVLRRLERRNGAPHLEVLHIELVSRTKAGLSTLNLLGGVARALRHLSLSRLAVKDWILQFTGPLLSLSLQKIYDSGSSLQQMIENLAGYPDF